jgi:metal-responsive CopG/Arc/MetJ family transcriptional regulator
MVDELDRIRRHEHRTRSELLREALRHYMAGAGSNGAHAVRVEPAQPDEIEAMRRAEAEYAEGRTVRLEDLQRELGLPTR